MWDPEWDHERENFLQTSKQFLINIFCSQKSKRFCFLVIYIQEVILFWSLPHHHHILSLSPCLLCESPVAEINSIIITTWLCLCWRHWDGVESSWDAIWSPPFLLWVSHRAVVKETSSFLPWSLPSPVLSWVEFQTPVPKMAITAIIKRLLHEELFFMCKCV